MFAYSNPNLAIIIYMVNLIQVDEENENDEIIAIPNITDLNDISYIYPYMFIFQFIMYLVIF